MNPAHPLAVQHEPRDGWTQPHHRQEAPKLQNMRGVGDNAINISSGTPASGPQDVVMPAKRLALAPSSPTGGQEATLGSPGKLIQPTALGE